MDKATPAAGRASRAPELDTARDCEIGELETSSASCSVTDSFAASYMEPAVTRVLVKDLFGEYESVIPPTLFVCSYILCLEYSILEFNGQLPKKPASLLEQSQSTLIEIDKFLKLFLPTKKVLRICALCRLFVYLI